MKKPGVDFKDYRLLLSRNYLPTKGLHPHAKDTVQSPFASTRGQVGLSGEDLPHPATGLHAGQPLGQTLKTVGELFVVDSQQGRALKQSLSGRSTV